MNNQFFWRLMIRLGLLIGLAGLLMAAVQPDLHVHAEEAALPPLQDDYPPFPTIDYGYDPQVTDTPPAGDPTATLEGYPADTPEATPTDPLSTGLPTEMPPLETPTPDSPPTGTVEAQATRTRMPTIPGIASPTSSMPTPTSTVWASLQEAEEEEGGFKMNWGMFWVGFSIPVVGACGVVLYLLDRRPEFFRPRRK